MLSPAIAALVLAVAAQPATAEPVDDLRVVVERRDGVHVKAVLPLDARSMRDVRAVWAWSSTLAPLRFDAGAALSVDAVALALRTPPSRGVRVQVSGWARREEIEGLVVIAAPADMWRTVPEPLLPTFPVDAEGLVIIPARDDIRLRAIGNERGSTWHDVPRSAVRTEVKLHHPVAEVEVRFVGPESKTVRAFAGLYLTPRGEAKPLFRAQFASDERGLVRVASVPADDALTLIVFAEGAAPQPVSAAAADFPALVRLQADAKVSGRFVDENGKPLPGIKVESDAWLDSGVGALARRRAESSGDGRWTIRGLPRGRASLRAESEQRRTWHAAIDASREDVDVGDIALPPATSVVLTVVDTAHRPLPRVRVTGGDGFSGTTDANGALVLRGLADDEGAVLTFSAARFITSTVRLAAPLPARERVVLQPAFSIAGKIVGEDGSVARDGVVTVAAANTHNRTEVAEDGTFTIDVEPGRAFDVTLESRSSLPVTRREAAGAAGELRDLGIIRLQGGRSLNGRVVDSSGAPVAGARVWVLRTSAAGSLIAWVEKRTAETRTGVDGRFVLRGLDGNPIMLRIDAAGFAPFSREAATDDGTGLGDLELTKGGSIVVDVRREDAALARADVGGRSVEADMITAPVNDGRAYLRNVPAGRHRVTVIGGRATVCEQFASVREGAEAMVVCPPPSRVSGRVLVGGSPAFRGTLSWSSGTVADALVVNRVSALGSLHQQSWGGGGDVNVPVGPDGSFESDSLRPGEWNVRWTSGEGVTTASRRVVLPASSDAPQLITFDGGVIRGNVVDREGRPVAGARIREVDGPLFAIAASDGSFVMAAVSPGGHRIQASLASEASAIENVVVEQGRTTPGVTLTLGARERNALEIEVVDERGGAVPGAFVFIEPAGGSMRLHTTDARGVATMLFDGSVPDSATIVAFANGRWAFADRRPLTGRAERREAVVRFGETGSVRIETKQLAGAPVIRSQLGGDLSWMMARIGSFPVVQPERPLVVGGLPPGAYEVILDNARTAVTVAAGKMATVEIE